MSESAAPVCDYCGLPLSGPAKPAPESQATSGAGPAASAREAAGRFCCFGCRFAAAIAHEGATPDQARTTMARLGLAVFLSMNVMTATMFLWSQEPGNTEQAATAANDLFRWMCLLFATPVMLLLGGPLFDDAWRELAARRLSASLLLSVGVLAAFGYSVWSVLWGGPIYFEVACTVLVAVTLGRWFEATGKLRTTAALAGLRKLLPSQVRRVRGNGTESIELERVRAGDTLRILPGERISVDGRIRRNQAAIDEQVVTGESVPVIKETGDDVRSGTLNLDGDLWIEATAAGGEGTLEQLVQAVQAAASRQAGYQRLADRLAAVFLPAVLVIAALAATWHAVHSGLAAGILAGLAVVVIACPCALGLATPMATWAALGRASRAGVLFRNGDALLKLATAQVICLDKTGTLTTGSPRLAAVHRAQAESPHDPLQVAAALAASSTHPLSRALTGGATQAKPGPLPTVSDLRSLAGRGVRGRLPEIAGEIFLGSPLWMQELGQQTPGIAPAAWQTALASDHPLAMVAWGGIVRGLFQFEETMRPGAAQAIRDLQARGLAVHLLTGDRIGRARAFATPLGIAVHAEVLPLDKQAVLTSLRRTGGVVMVGDGINDAPALAAADVGVALGCGTDISRHTAGVCLLGDDLARLPWTIDLARATARTIRWNLVWAFGYNTAGIAIAAAGWLNPIVAAMAMVASSLLVISNSLRLAGDEPATEPRASGAGLGEPLSAAKPLPLAPTAGSLRHA